MTHTVKIYSDASFASPISTAPGLVLAAACTLANAEAAAGRYARILDTATGRLIADTHPPVDLVGRPTTRAPATS